MVLRASSVVGSGFPPEEGQELGRLFLQLYEEHQHPPHTGWPWEVCGVDLRGLPSAMLIGGFFHALLQTIYDADPELMEKFRKHIRWRCEWSFQEGSIREWVKDFRPVIRLGNQR